MQKALAVDIEKQRKAEEARRKACAQVLLYWCKNANTDAAALLVQKYAEAKRRAGSRFACFTCTNVQILTQLLRSTGGQARKDFAMSTADYKKNLADRLAKIKDGQGLLMQVLDLDLPALLVQTYKY